MQAGGSRGVPKKSHAARHATHQFFLTKRSVYLMVMDSRENEQQSLIGYWVIESFGGDSLVIIVCNRTGVPAAIIPSKT